MIRYCVAAALFILTACGNNQGEDAIGLRLEQIGKIGSETPEGPSAAQIRARLTPDVMARRPGSVIVASLPKRDVAAALFQASVNGDVTTYFTPDGISLALRDGILVGTRGLGFDLMTANVDGPLSAIAGGSQTNVVRIHHYLNGENAVTLRRFICNYTRTAAMISETCRSPDVTISNSYTMTSDGRIGASRQWISPEVGYVQVDQIRL